MPNLNQVLKEEIARVARKEIKSQTAQMKRASVSYRRDIADLKRRLADSERRVRFLEGRETKRVQRTPAAAADGKRFSPKWLKSHRAKIGFSAAEYAKLVGVTPLTIYNWEQGKSRPRQSQLASIAKVRNLGKREARHQLGLIS